MRETVRQLMQAKKFDQVIALINAALRHQQAQPWMYEVLDLAMRAAEKSPEDRERRAALGRRFQRHQRRHHVRGLLHVPLRPGSPGTLKLFHQVSRREPTRHEPYMHGLALAQQLKDLDGIQWTTVGVLSQAWPKEQAELWSKAYRAAAATLEQLRRRATMQKEAEFVRGGPE